MDILTNIKKLCRIGDAANLIAQVAYENGCTIEVASAMILALAEKQLKVLEHDKQIQLRVNNDTISFADFITKYVKEDDIDAPTLGELQDFRELAQGQSMALAGQYITKL